MKNLYTFLLVFTAIFCGINYVSAQTNVAGGNVSGTWTLAGSPYLINGSIQIPNGQTLTIEPGVTVDFQGHYKIYVQGRILAIGTVSDTITFTAQDTTTGWKGIRFDNTPTTNDSSKFVYCKVQYGRANGTGDEANGGGFYFLNYSKVNISNCLISNNSALKYGGGIYCKNSNIKIINDLISQNKVSDINARGGGIYCYHSSPAIFRNIIITNYAGNAGGGIACDSASSPSIINDTISNNIANGGGGGGIFCSNNCNPVISNNEISYNIIEGRGGGILCIGNCSPSIINNTINNNTSIYFGTGGGINFMDGGNPLIFNNVISYNYTDGYGGGISIDESSPSIIQNTISFNNADIEGGGIAFLFNNFIGITDNNIYNNTAGDGGGISCYGNMTTSPAISNNNIFSNIAYNRGGGIYIYSNSTPTLLNNRIKNNSAYSGGGIFLNYGSFPVIKNDSIYENSANIGGGISCDKQSNPSIINCNIFNNNSTLKGGGIYCYNQSNPKIKNSTITNNSSSFGGGINSDSLSNPTLINSTISNNSSDFGGAIYCKNSSDPIIKNSIIWGNAATTSGSQVYLFTEDSDPNIYYSNVQGGDAAFGTNDVFYTGIYQNNLDSDPLFVAPTAGSGTSYDGTTADWSLQAGSPCINAGTIDTTGLNLPSTDIAGNPRVSNGRIDIGAYEHLGTSINNPITNNLINIYPNPNNGKFLLYLENYESKNYELQIYDITGQIIYSKNYENTVVLAENIDISEFESGVYLVKISEGENVFCNHIIIYK